MAEGADTTQRSSWMDFSKNVAMGLGALGAAVATASVLINNAPDLVEFSKNVSSAVTEQTKNFFGKSKKCNEKLVDEATTLTTTSVVRKLLKEPEIKPPAAAPETKIPASATSNKSKGKRAVEVREEEEEPDDDDDDSDEEFEALKQKLKAKKRLKRKKTGALDEQRTDSTRAKPSRLNPCVRASAAVAESRWKQTLEEEKRSPGPQAMESPPPPIPVTVIVEEEVPEATTPVTESEMLAHPTADTEPVLEAIQARVKSFLATNPTEAAEFRLMSEAPGWTVLWKPRATVSDKGPKGDFTFKYGGSSFRSYKGVKNFLAANKVNEAEVEAPEPPSPATATTTDKARPSVEMEMGFDAKAGLVHRLYYANATVKVWWSKDKCALGQMEGFYEATVIDVAADPEDPDVLLHKLKYKEDAYEAYHRLDRMTFEVVKRESWLLEGPFVGKDIAVSLKKKLWRSRVVAYLPATAEDPALFKVQTEDEDEGGMDLLDLETKEVEKGIKLYEKFVKDDEKLNEKLAGIASGDADTTDEE